MSRPRAPAHALAVLAVAGGCAVAGLPDSVRPRGADGRVWPDVVGPVDVHFDGRRDAALILSVEDYRVLPDRAGAHAIAGAWYRHLHELRGLRPRRIHWLRDGEVTPVRVRDALLKAHWAVGADATMWIVVVGHVGSSPALPHGVLLGATSKGAGDPREDVRIVDLLMRGGHGYHRETVAIVDGCLPGAPAGSLQSGASARSLPSLRGWHDAPQTSVTIPSFGGTGESVSHDLVRRREPTDLAEFTAGVGAHCVESLPGAGAPALAYLLLGALRGWADEDGDGRVTAAEAVRSVERLLRRAGARAGRVEARGADIVLARGGRERGPEVPAVAPEAPEGEPAAPAAFVDDRMRKIDRGAFILGCRSRRDPQCERDEFPARRIYVESFAIDRYEVSWRQYEECVAAGACSKVATARCNVWTGEAFVLGAAIPAAFLGPDQPVVCATWTQAAEYCAWVGKRLPTEAEWERAARGGSGRQYPWGDEPPTCARAQNHQCGDVTSPVGSHPAGATPEGVHDLAGNVSEWVHDWYGKRSYRYLARYNPRGFDKGEVRVIRGGSFYDGHGYLRASYRYGLSPQFGYGTVGFRCAR